MEPFINLRDEWLLGIDALDDQHRVLSDGLNQLVQACHEYSESENGDKEQQRIVLGKLIDALYKGTREHFEFEEAMMKKEAYPGYASHAREHAMLLAELKSTIADRLESGRYYIDPDVFKALKSWFIVHLTHSDRDFAHFIAVKKSARTGN
jgi:hemerythrin